MTRSSLAIGLGLVVLLAGRAHAEDRHRPLTYEIDLGLRIVMPPGEGYWDTLRVYGYGGDKDSAILAGDLQLGLRYPLFDWLELGGGLGYLINWNSAGEPVDETLSHHVLEPAVSIRAVWSLRIRPSRAARKRRAPPGAIGLGAELAVGPQVVIARLRARASATAALLVRPALIISIGDEVFRMVSRFGYSLSHAREGEPALSGFFASLGFAFAP